MYKRQVHYKHPGKTYCPQALRAKRLWTMSLSCKYLGLGTSDDGQKMLAVRVVYAERGRHLVHYNYPGKTHCPQALRAKRLWTISVATKIAQFRLHKDCTTKIAQQRLHRKDCTTTIVRGAGTVCYFAERKDSTRMTQGPSSQKCYSRTHA